MSQPQRSQTRDKFRQFFRSNSSRAASPKSHTESTRGSAQSQPGPQPGSPSPWKMASSGAQIVLSGLERCLDGVPIAGNVVKAVNVLTDIANAVKDNKEDLSQLCNLVKSRLEAVDSRLDETKVSSDIKSAAEDFVKVLGDNLHAMQDICGRQTWKAVLKSSENRARVARFVREIQEQTTKFQLDISLCIELNLEGIKDNIERLLLNNWVRSKHAQWNISPTDVDPGSIDQSICTDGTRYSVLEKIKTWASDPTSSPVFWMDGEGGSGKSTIARTIAHHFDTTKGFPRPLTFFCSRKFDDARRQVYIIPTIVYQLCWQSRAFASALCRTPTELAMEVLSKQMEVLFVQPWKDAIVTRSPDLPPVLVIVDALDEIEQEGGFKFLQMLLETLEVQQQHLQGIKFLITSRPNPQLKELCGSFPSDAVCELYTIPKAEVEKDILKYLESEMHELRSNDDDNILEDIARNADGLFIAAATAIRYCKRDSRLTRSEQLHFLKKLVENWSDNTTGMDLVDSMYQQVLTDLFIPLRDTPDAYNTRRDILHSILCTEERVSVEGLAKILGHDQEHIEEIQETISKVLECLHAVLRISNGKIEWYHTSFLDFMFNPGRSNFVYHDQRMDLYCDITHQHNVLTRHCFQVMQLSLRFNICGLASSFIPDNEVENLVERVHKEISEGLVYACLYWANHLTSAPYNEPKWDKVQKDLEKFLRNQLLFWIEVMSLLKESSRCGAALNKIRLWLKKTEDEQQLLSDVYDALKLTLSFVAHPTSTYTAHLYISSLAGSSPGSKLLTHWRNQFRDIPLIEFNGTAEVELMSLTGHTGTVVSVAFSTDGLHIVSGSEDCTVRIWEGQSGKEVQRVEGHTDQVTSVAFSPDSQQIVSGSEDKTVRIWDRQSAREIQRLEGHTDLVRSVAFSPDSQQIVSGSYDKTVRIWDRKSGKEIQRLEGHTELVTSVAFSLDSQQIMSGSGDKTVRIWDRKSGREIHRLEGHTELVTSVAFSWDGQEIVSGSDDKTVRIWDRQSGKQIQRLKGHTDWVTSVAYSPDSQEIVSGSYDKTVRIWHRHSGREIQRLEGHTHWVTSVAFSPDSQQIVSASYDRTVRIWDRHGGEMLIHRLEGHTDSVTSVAFSPGSHQIVSGSGDNTVRIWDRQSGKEIQRLEGHTHWVTSVAFSPDSKQIVSGSYDNTVMIWDRQSGKEIQRLEGHTHWVTSVAFSPDNHQIMSGSYDKTVRIWDRQSGREIQRLEGHTEWVTSVAFSPDSQQIVSASYDRTVRIWDRQSGREIQRLEGHTDWVTSVAFSPDSQHIASGSEDKTVMIWGRQSGREVQRLEGHTGLVISVAYSPDSKQIVSGSYDKTVRIWDAESGTEIQRLEGHTQWVTSLAFSPNSQQVVSGSGDKTVRIWDIQSGRETQRSEGHTDRVTSVAFSPDSQPLVSGSDDQIMAIWDRPSDIQIHLETNSANRSLYIPTKYPLSWCIGQDSWLVSVSGSAPLLWLPSHLHPGLYTSPTSLIISCNGTTKVSFTNSKLGIHWADCYTPQFN